MTAPSVYPARLSNQRAWKPRALLLRQECIVGGAEEQLGVDKSTGEA